MSEDLTRIIDDVLRTKLGPHGFDHAEVKEGADHAGEDALFIDAFLKPNSALVGGRVANEAHGAVSDALLERGERRFPYFLIRYPDDEPAEPPSMEEPTLS